MLVFMCSEDILFQRHSQPKVLFVTLQMKKVKREPKVLFIDNLLQK